MTRLFRRRAPDRQEEVTAAGAALGAAAAVGLTVWYFARLWLGRERLDRERPAAERRGGERPANPGARDLPGEGGPAP